MHSSHSGNPIINSLIDALMLINDLDPTWVNPDHHLKNDLHLNEENIINITKFIEKKLSLNFKQDQYSSITKATTLREMVDVLSEFSKTA